MKTAEKRTRLTAEVNATLHKEAYHLGNGKFIPHWKVIEKGLQYIKGMRKLEKEAPKLHEEIISKYFN